MKFTIRLLAKLGTVLFLILIFSRSKDVSKLLGFSALKESNIKRFLKEPNSMCQNCNLVNEEKIKMPLQESKSIKEQKFDSKNFENTDRELVPLNSPANSKIDLLNSQKIHHQERLE